MKARSAKNKGKRLQNILRDKLIELYPALKDDIGSQIMGVTGEDIVLTPHARTLLPYSFECKNVEKINKGEKITFFEFWQRNGGIQKTL